MCDVGLYHEATSPVILTTNSHKTVDMSLKAGRGSKWIYQYIHQSIEDKKHLWEDAFSWAEKLIRDVNTVSDLFKINVICKDPQF